MDEPTIAAHMTASELGYCIAQLEVALGGAEPWWTVKGLEDIEALRARLSALYVARFSDITPAA